MADAIELAAVDALADGQYVSLSDSRPGMEGILADRSIE